MKQTQHKNKTKLLIKSLRCFSSSHLFPFQKHFLSVCAHLIWLLLSFQTAASFVFFSGPFRALAHSRGVGSSEGGPLFAPAEKPGPKAAQEGMEHRDMGRAWRTKSHYRPSMGAKLHRAQTPWPGLQTALLKGQPAALANLSWPNPPPQWFCLQAIVAIGLST